MVLDRNPENFFAEVEQASFNPSNLVPGTGLSPGPDADGADLQLPRHAPAPHRPELRAAADQPPAVPRPLLQQGRADDLPPRGRPARVRAELLRRARPPTRRSGTEIGWDVDAAELARTAYEKHAEDDDFCQPGTLVRDVMDDAAARRRSSRTSSATPPTTCRPRCSCGSIAYWTRVDAQIGRARRRGPRPHERLRPRRRRAARARRSWSTPAPAAPERQRPRRSARTRRPPPRRGRRSTRRP